MLMVMISGRDLPGTTTRTGPAVPKVMFGAAGGGTSYRDDGEHGGGDLFPHGLSVQGSGGGLPERDDCVLPVLSAAVNAVC